MNGLIDAWFFSSIAGERGAKATEVEHALLDLYGSSAIETHCFENVVDAYHAAKATLTPSDCLLVFGSFFIVGDILRLLEST